jgi:hypothetical protein
MEEIKEATKAKSENVSLSVTMSCKCLTSDLNYQQTLWYMFIMVSVDVWITDKHGNIQELKIHSK